MKEVVIAREGDFRINPDVICRYLRMKYHVRKVYIYERVICSCDLYTKVLHTNADDILFSTVDHKQIIRMDNNFYSNKVKLDSVFDPNDQHDSLRCDVDLISAIRSIGIKNSSYSIFTKLKIVKIPDGVDYYIKKDPDGFGEIVVEKCRIWK